jgi:hypothetical protein
MIKQIIEDNKDEFGLLSEYDLEYNKSDQIKFGKLMERFVGRILSDIKLVSEGNKRKSRNKYQFKKISNESGKGDQYDQSKENGHVGNTCNVSQVTGHSNNNKGSVIGKHDKIDQHDQNKVISEEEVKESEEKSKEELDEIRKWMEEQVK